MLLRGLRGASRKRFFCSSFEMSRKNLQDFRRAVPAQVPLEVVDVVVSASCQNDFAPRLPGGSF